VVVVGNCCWLLLLVVVGAKGERAERREKELVCILAGAHSHARTGASFPSSLLLSRRPKLELGPLELGELSLGSAAKLELSQARHSSGWHALELEVELKLEAAHKERPHNVNHFP